MEPTSPAEKRPRKSKEALDSRTFRDGQIYLYRRQDYKKQIWFCRIKVPKTKGYVFKSTQTSDEHEHEKSDRADIIRINGHSGNRDHGCKGRIKGSRYDQKVIEQW